MIMNKKIFLLLAVLVGLPTYVLAGLGGTVDSFKNDSTPVTVSRHFATTTSSSAAMNYSTQQMHDDAGNLITEYVSTNGIVFALTWRGLFKPDLHQLLGDYFQTYLAVESGSSGRQAPVVDQDSVVVVSEGRLRNFHGKAYIPALIPNGFSLDDLK